MPRGILDLGNPPDLERVLRGMEVCPGISPGEPKRD
ncbi:MAG: hypothetical protein CM1200mP15_16850 [Dehalococcoidia bacterium]|nr:MAG: hypothetical protein CM1200mP15_16850 [Dehalococcoidia bacterium]